MGESWLQSESIFLYLEGRLSRVYASMLMDDHNFGSVSSVLRKENVEILKRQEDPAAHYLRGNLKSILIANKILKDLVKSSPLAFDPTPAYVLPELSTSTPPLYLQSSPPLTSTSPLPLQSSPPSTSTAPPPHLSSPPLTYTSPPVLQSSHPPISTPPLPLQSSPPSTSTSPLPLQSSPTSTSPLHSQSSPPSTSTPPQPFQSSTPQPPNQSSPPSTSTSPPPLQSSPPSTSTSPPPYQSSPSSTSTPPQPLQSSPPSISSPPQPLQSSPKWCAQLRSPQQHLTDSTRSTASFNPPSSLYLEEEEHQSQPQSIGEYSSLPSYYLSPGNDTTDSSLECISEGIGKYARVQRLGAAERQLYVLDRLRGESSKSKFYELVSSFKYSCDLCSFQSKRRSHMDKHKLVHKDNPVIFFCSEKQCSYRCIRNGDLTRHRASMHTSPQNLFQCGTCNYRTQDQKGFLRHNKYFHQRKKTSVDEILYQCVQCDYKTMRLMFFRRHMKRHDVHLDNTETIKGNRQIIQCDLCKYSTKHSDHLKRHKTSVHLKERKYMCDFCGMSFKRKDILQQHTLRHSNTSRTKSYSCDQCENSYLSLYSLKDHLAMHENKKAVQCTRCEKAFNTNAILQKHMKNVHDTPGYKCDICSKVLNTSFNLKRHKERHAHAEEAPAENNYSAYILDEKDFIDGEFISSEILMEQTSSGTIQLMVD